MAGTGRVKTTVMRILCGLMHPSKGCVEIMTDRPYRQSIGYLPQSIRFDSNQRAEDIIRFFGKIKKSNVDHALMFAEEMDMDMEKAAREMSPGQQRKLQLAVASIGDPELMVFDEPTAGLDPTGVQQVREIIRELNRRGSTVFISSHVLMELDTICHKVAVIDQGQLLYQGAFESVYQLDTCGDAVRINNLLEQKFTGCCTVSEDRVLARLDRAAIPDLLGYLYENGVPIYGVKRLGLEVFYNDLMKESA